MNTGNLQIEGLLLAIAMLNRRLVEKGLLTLDEIEESLHKAEAFATGDERIEELSPANRDAVCFPIRFLRIANREGGVEEGLYFSELTRRVGTTKAPYNDQQ